MATATVTKKSSFSSTDMRTNLKNLVGLRDWFIGVYEDRSSRKLPGCDDFEDTALITAIRYKNVVLTEHLWFPWNPGLERLKPRPGNIITFLATVAVYSKAQGFDCELKNAIWQQPATKDPQPLPVRSIPQSLEEAQKLLNSFGCWDIQDKNRQIRVTEWNPELLERLVLEGWCEMSPNNFDYWAKQSKAFARLVDGLRRDRNVMRYAQLASIINGATVSMFSQDGWGDGM